jgi:REP element-mobilizing transposase RayT
MRNASAPLFRNRYRIPSARLRGWDYKRPGIYYVTIRTQRHDGCLGEVIGGEASRSRFGEIVAREWRWLSVPYPRVELDDWIVMPDHLHGILILKPTSEPTAPLGTILGTFKSKSTKSIRAMGHRGFAWQDRFHDHILENLDALEPIRAYIRQNPQRWQARHNTPITSPLGPRGTVP